MLTPKEKAEELVDKYICYADGVDRQEDHDQIEEHLENAKQCALITVEEIQKIVPYRPATFINLKTNEVQEIMGFDEGSYWEKVKQEIEKL
jgi:hypothetical protein